VNNVIGNRIFTWRQKSGSEKIAGLVSQYLLLFVMRQWLHMENFGEII
jgi:hypothetical protein